jgi:hypothetical protein
VNVGVVVVVVVLSSASELFALSGVVSAGTSCGSVGSCIAGGAASDVGAGLWSTGKFGVGIAAGALLEMAAYDAILALGELGDKTFKWNDKDTSAIVQIRASKCAKSLCLIFPSSPALSAKVHEGNKKNFCDLFFFFAILQHQPDTARHKAQGHRAQVTKTKKYMTQNCA